MDDGDMALAVEQASKSPPTASTTPKVTPPTVRHRKKAPSTTPSPVSAPGRGKRKASWLKL